MLALQVESFGLKYYVFANLTCLSLAKHQGNFTGRMGWHFARPTFLPPPHLRPCLLASAVVERPHLTSFLTISESARQNGLSYIVVLLSSQVFKTETAHTFMNGQMCKLNIKLDLQKL